MPLAPLDSTVSVHVEIFEPVSTVVVHAGSEELRAVERIVTIPIRAKERLPIEVPFVGRYEQIAVVVERGEPGVRPGQKPLRSRRIVICLIEARGVPCPNSDLIA
jgi:hypothetical protein